MSDVVRSVVATQGVLGMWRGATPSVLRLILLNSTMVATYDEVRQQHVGTWRQGGCTASSAAVAVARAHSHMQSVFPAVLRCAQVKGHIRAATGWGGLPLVLSSSMVAGVVTTTTINPCDVVRAYMQTGRGSAPLEVARGILAREGAAGFMKGWTAAYCRTGPQTLIIFTVSEFVRPLFGLKAIGNA